jgi:ABC-type phosphate/phosphonate transport system substrate-binding protein
LKHLRFVAVLAAMMLVVSACTGGGTSSADQSEGAPESQAPASQGGSDPDELVIGFVPSSEAGQLVEDI